MRQILITMPRTKGGLIEEICTLRIFHCGAYKPGVREAFVRQARRTDKAVLVDLWRNLQARRNPRTNETWIERETRIASKMEALGL